MENSESKNEVVKDEPAGEEVNSPATQPSPGAIEDAVKKEEMEVDDGSGEGASESSSAVNKKKKRKKDRKNDVDLTSESNADEATYASDEGKEYCICRSTDTKRFMICCDNCAEWYHGDCMQVNRTQAKHIEKYFCTLCISKDPSLEIIYTAKYLKAKARKEEQAGLAAIVAAMKEEEAAEKDSSTAHSTASPSTPSTSTSHVSSLRCGNCIGCFRSMDCGKCDACAVGQPCQKRACVQADLLANQRRSLMRASGGGGVVHSKARERRKDRRRDISSDDDTTYMPEKQPHGTPEKGKRGRKKGWRKDGTHLSPEKQPQQMPKLEPPEERIENVINLAATSSQFPVEARLMQGRNVYIDYDRIKNRRKKKMPELDAEERQCLGMNCVEAARPNSKYCSDDCGIRLAKERLRTILPQRVDEYWKEEPVSKRRSDAAERALVDEIERMHEEKQRIAEWMTFLQQYIAVMKNVKPLADDEEDSQQDITVNCPVCSTDYNANQVAKHIERCFVRLEKQVTYGTTIEKTANPDNLFCDVYNKINKTFCKRLRVMCPEHYKGEDEAELEVCGCPKRWSGERSHDMAELFADTVEKGGVALLDKGYCMQERKKCQQHHRWIQTMLGHLESARHRILMRMDEMFDQKARLGASRLLGDPILLLCNKTTYHQSLEDILRRSGVVPNSNSTNS